MNQRSALIAGAGIGGLTAALALSTRGIEVSVLERASELTPVGVGINLLPHAVGGLHRLGLGEKLSRIAVAPGAISYYDPRGNLLFREPRGVEGGYRWPQLSVHRGKLQMMLLAGVRERVGPAAVQSGTAVVGFDQAADQVVVRTDRGDIGADALVGADGLHSRVLAQLHPDHDPLLWSGVRMWRGVSSMEPFLDGRTMAIIKAQRGVELVVYPIGDNLTNWVLLVADSRPGLLSGDAKWTELGDPARVRAHMDDWRLGWLDVQEMIDRTDEVLEYPMVDRGVLPWWGCDRVTLLGDAAHPMYPVGANGGSQAILDACVLADRLGKDFDTGLRAYEDERRPATSDVVVANREMYSAGNTQRSNDLARVAARYRRDTHADADSRRLYG
jgi:2-polyprenyl-6-methoxyphenol hydroxylase-like FAD-dependent oxidoreductase